MTDRNTHTNYTAEDIERYLNGGMSAKEMHEMEKAALQDPFLADAIEGYSEASMQQSHQHLNEITALLQKDQEAAKVVVMPTKSFQWWRVAAVIILLAGLGGFSWYIVGNNSPETDVQNVAALQENNQPLKESGITAIKADTTILIGEATKANETAALVKKNKQLQAVKESNAAMAGKQEAASNIVRADDTSKDIAGDIVVMDADSISTIAAIPGIAPGIDVTKANKKQIFTPMQGKGAGVVNNNAAFNNFSGFVMDNNNQPVPNALVSAGNQRAAFTDKNGYFNVISPDTTLKVSVSSVGYSTTNVQLSQGYANRISIEPDEQSLSEMVVTGYGSKKKVAENIKTNGGDTTYPAGGWQSFQEYVYKKMNKPFDSTNNAIITSHGSVEIELSVDEDGDPYNINVIKSSGTKNDEKVIQVIKEGPRWISSKKHKKSKVVISF